MTLCPDFDLADFTAYDPAILHRDGDDPAGAFVLSLAFDPSNLRYMRLFFQRFPNRGAMRHRLPSQGIRDALRHKSTGTGDPGDLRPELSWTHYRLLLGVEDARARAWYMNEAADQNWATRQLDRQISVLYYERLLASREKAPVRKEAREKLAASPRNSSSATRTCLSSST